MASFNTEDIKENSENRIDAAKNEPYGIVYTPSYDGEYTKNSYNAATKDVLESDNDEISRQGVSRSRKRPKAIVIISLLILGALLISFVSAFSGAMIVKLNYDEILLNSDSGREEKEKQPTRENVIFKDDSNPGYSVQDHPSGKLMSMEQAIGKVKDSVVEITTERVQSGFGSYSQYVVSGAGSGVLISTGGYIITNYHVIEGASNITVRLTSGSEYTAKLIGSDSKTDIAVISIEPNEDEILVAAVIANNDSLRLGQTVIAIGNPLGKLGGTVTDGIISCLAREIVIEGSGSMTLLQTNAAVSPGNSGGGLFDLYGRLIGIVNAKSTGEGVEGVSFAIPVDTAWNVASQLIDKGYVSGRPCLGVSVKEVQYGYSIFGEVYYHLVVAEDDSQTGLKLNDIILSVDEKEVNHISDLSDILATKNVGDKITVTVRRNKKLIEIEIALVEYIPEK